MGRAHILCRNEVLDFGRNPSGQHSHRDVAGMEITRLASPSLFESLRLLLALFNLAFSGVHEYPRERNEIADDRRQAGCASAFMDEPDSPADGD